MSIDMDEYHSLFENCKSNIRDNGLWAIFTDFLEENEDEEEAKLLLFKERKRLIRAIIARNFSEIFDVLGVEPLDFADSPSFGGTKSYLFLYVGIERNRVTNLRFQGFSYSFLWEENVPDNVKRILEFFPKISQLMGFFAHQTMGASIGRIGSGSLANVTFSDEAINRFASGVVIRGT